MLLDYIIQVLLFQTLFLAVYDIVLKKETFFQWNRAYLLITSVIAYCIPFIKFTGFQKVMPQEYMILLPEVMLSPTTVIQKQFDWSNLLFNGLQIVFILGAVGAFLMFVIKLYRLIQLIVKSEKKTLKNYQLVLLENSKAFSFFNYIFLGKSLSDDQKDQVISHELVHVQQKHSIDLFIFEIQKIVCWFNPFSYLFQNRIAELHEFIADAKIVKATNKKEYFQNLLSQTFGTQKLSFINSFLKISLIKKRIIMLNKEKSKQILKLKYLLLIPVLLSMLVYTSSVTGQEIIIAEENFSEGNENHVVPFAEVINSPVFPGCEDDSDPKECFNKNLQRFVARNFDASIGKSLNLTPGTKKIYVHFKINKNGDIVDVKPRAPHKALEKEAARVMNSVPKLLAGENENDEKVVVKYVLPIGLMIQ